MIYRSSEQESEFILTGIPELFDEYYGIPDSTKTRRIFHGNGLYGKERKYSLRNTCSRGELNRKKEYRGTWLLIFFPLKNYRNCSRCTVLIKDVAKLRFRLNTVHVKS